MGAKATLLALALLCNPAAADTAFSPAQRDEIVAIVRDALKRDPSLLRDAIGALQADESRARSMTSREAVAANRARLTRPTDPSIGPADADVTVVQFYDIRCPYCRKMDPALTELVHADPRVRVVFKDLPILGPSSLLGAKALLAANRQGKYFPLHQILLRAGPEPTKESLLANAQTLGLDTARFTRDAESPEIAAQLQDTIALSQALSIAGTPGTVIGPELISGALDLAELRELVAAARK